ncbi:MAG: hypothetical protein QF774_10970, partial [Nitrospinota bacterium]|nr:hypothetical protein [Nitrospinota bacterium]
LRDFIDMNAFHGKTTPGQGTEKLTLTQPILPSALRRLQGGPMGNIGKAAIRAAETGRTQ